MRLVADLIRGKRVGEAYAILQFTKKKAAEQKKAEAVKRALERPVHASFLLAAPKPREGFITLTLNTGFLHAEYRKRYVELALTFARASKSNVSARRSAARRMVSRSG